jgi:anti-repressor protein
MVMARALKLADTKIKRLELQIEEQKPLVEFADKVTKSCDNILIRDMAKLLCDQKINIGEKRLYKLLRCRNILMDDNTPYQSYIDRGYFYIKESTYNTPYGEKITTTTLVTPKGQVWLVSKVKEWLREDNAKQK